MKLKNLFWAIVAGAAALVSCEKEVDLGPAKISASPAEVTFTKEAGSQEITLNSSRDWKVNSGIPEWIALSKESGVADTKDQKVTISVTSNSGHDRSATLVFNIGYAKASVLVKQAGPEGEIDLGDGTLEKPFTVAGVLAYTRALPADQASDKNVYFKGKISSVATTFEASGTYGNATFYIVDEDGGESFYVFQTYYLGNRKWKSGDTDVQEGDNVIVCGKVVNYKGNTPETVSKGGSFIYSLNGKSEGGEPAGEGEAKGDGSLENPFNPAGITAVAAALADNAQSEQSYYIKGKISNVKTSFAASGTYGNATFYIVDETDGTGEFYIYQTYYLEGKKWVSGQPDVAVGDIVTVYGPVTKYVSNYGTTLETVGKGASYIFKHEKGQGGDEPGGETGEIKAVSVAEFLAASVSATQWYELTGTVSNIKSDVYGNFDLTDASGTIYIYGLTATKVEKNDKSFASLNIKEGDKITIITLRAEYNGTAQGGGTPPAYIKGSDNPGGGDEPGGDTTHAGTLADPYTVADAAAAVANLTWTSNSDYQKVGPYYVKGKIASIKYTYSAQYGTATFNISDDGGTSSTQFTCYSVKYFGGESWVEGNTQVAVGDEVIIYGELQNYKGNTPETVSGAYVYSLNGKTSEAGGEGGDEPGGDEPGGGDNPGTGSGFTSNVSWTTGTNSYEETALINNESNVKVLKLGTSKATGSSTLTLPAGSTSLTFYAISWSGKQSKVVFKVSGEEVASKEPAANSGASGNQPYTITVSDSDKYTINFSATSTITVETSGSNTRVILFGVNAQ